MVESGFFSELRIQQLCQILYLSVLKTYRPETYLPEGSNLQVEL